MCSMLCLELSHCCHTAKDRQLMHGEKSGTLNAVPCASLHGLLEASPMCISMDQTMRIYSLRASIKAAGS